MWGGVAKGCLRGPHFCLEAVEAHRPVPPEPEIELAAGDSEEAARLADVLGYLLVVLDPSQADLRSAKLVLLPFRLSHSGPPR